MNAFQRQRVFNFSILAAVIVVLSAVFWGTDSYSRDHPLNAVKTGGIYVRAESDLKLHTIEVNSRIAYPVSTTLSQEEGSGHGILAVDKLCLNKTDFRSASTEVPDCHESPPRPATSEEVQLWNSLPH